MYGGELFSEELGRTVVLPLPVGPITLYMDGRNVRRTWSSYQNTGWTHAILISLFAEAIVLVASQKQVGNKVGIARVVDLAGRRESARVHWETSLRAYIHTTPNAV